MEKISMGKISEVLKFHLKLGLSIRQSGKAANVSKSVASRYCNRFNEIALNINEFLQLNELQQEKLFYPNKLQKSSSSKIKPDCLYLHNELKKKKKN